jgi:hypothetical protein
VRRRRSRPLRSDPRETNKAACNDLRSPSPSRRGINSRDRRSNKQPLAAASTHQLSSTVAGGYIWRTCAYVGRATLKTIFAVTRGKMRSNCFSPRSAPGRSSSWIWIWAATPTPRLLLLPGSPGSCHQHPLQSPLGQLSCAAAG